MKLSIATTNTALASMAITSLVSYPTGAAAAASCTHGKLFVSSIDDTTVRVLDLNSGLDNIALDYSVDVSEAGPELNLAKDTSSKVVSVIYRGTEENLYQVRKKTVNTDGAEKIGLEDQDRHPISSQQRHVSSICHLRLTMIFFLYSLPRMGLFVGWLRVFRWKSMTTMFTSNTPNQR